MYYALNIGNFKKHSTWDFYLQANPEQKLATVSAPMIMKPHPVIQTTEL